MVQFNFKMKFFSDFNRNMCFLILLILVTLCKHMEASQRQKPSALEFKKRAIVRPVVLHARTRRQILTTRDTNGEHHSEVSMMIPIDGEELVLDLRLNHDLITDNHVLKYYKNGQPVIQRMNKRDIELCEYGGSVQQKPGSWVALSTCQGVSGIVFDGKITRHIEPAAGADIQSDHYVYDDADPNDNHESWRGDENSNHSKRYKRWADEVQESHYYADSDEVRYVELALVVSNSYYQTRDRDIHAVNQEMKKIVNIVNSIYSPFKVAIALVGVEIWTEGDRIQIERPMHRTLDTFLKYRQTSLSESIPNDNAHLLTTWRQFDNDGVLGVGMVGAMCSDRQSGGVSKITSEFDTIGQIAITLAHEMGHNFNMSHDKDECSCPDKTCIMNPYSNKVSHWSSCSVKSFKTAINKIDSCLKNQPPRLFGGPICGNGFVDRGEQCDCGDSTTGENKLCLACCDQRTCKLRPNAACAAGRCCDLHTCQMKPRGMECRAAHQECDLAEFCTGSSEFCPADVFKMDTTACGHHSENAYCYRGRCGSRTAQCRVLMKDPNSCTAPDDHYNHNTRASMYGHCGRDYTTLSQNLKGCNQRDVMCGALHCLKEGVSIITTSDVGPNVEDPTLVPDGAGCGTGMICQQQKCVSIASIRESLVRRNIACPTNCSGHGICDTKGQCHCDPGFAPALCLPATSNGRVTGIDGRNKLIHDVTSPPTGGGQINSPPRQDRPVYHPPEEDRPVYHPPKEDRPIHPPPKQNKPVYPPPRENRPINPSPKPNKPVYIPPREDRPVYPPPREDKPVHNPPRENRPINPSPKPNKPVFIPPREDRPVYPPPREDKPVHNPPRENRPINPSPKPNKPVYIPPREDRPVYPPPREHRPVYPPPREERPIHPSPKPNKPVYIPPRENRPVYPPPRENRPVYPPPRENRPINPSPKPNKPVYIPPREDRPVYPPPRENRPVYPPPREERPIYHPPKQNKPIYSPAKPDRPVYPPPIDDRSGYPPPEQEKPVSTLPKYNNPTHIPPKRLRPDHNPNTSPETSAENDVIMYVIFLGVIPAILLMFLACYFWRNKLLLCYRTLPVYVKSAKQETAIHSKINKNIENDKNEPVPVKNHVTRSVKGLHANGTFKEENVHNNVLSKERHINVPNKSHLQASILVKSDNIKNKLPKENSKLKRIDIPTKNTDAHVDGLKVVKNRKDWDTKKMNTLQGNMPAIERHEDIEIKNANNTVAKNNHQILAKPKVLTRPDPTNVRNKNNIHGNIANKIIKDNNTINKGTSKEVVKDGGQNSNNLNKANNVQGNIAVTIRKDGDVHNKNNVRVNVAKEKIQPTKPRVLIRPTVPPPPPAIHTKTTANKNLKFGDVPRNQPSVSSSNPIGELVSLFEKRQKDQNK